MFRRASTLVAILGIPLYLAAAHASEETGRRAAALYRDGNVAEARALLERWISDEPESVDAHIAFTQFRALLGERERVRAEYEEKAAANPGNRAVRIAEITLLTRSLLQYKAFDEFLERNEDFARGWEEYGRVLLEAYRPRDAVGVLEKAVSLDPNRAKAHLYLGLAYRARRDVEKEMAELRRAHELDPNDPLIGLELGTTLAFEGRGEEAASVLSDLRDDLGDDPELLSVLALVLRETGDVEESERLRARTLEVDPGYLDRLLYVGIQCRGTDQYHFGRKILELAAFLDPEFVEAYMQLGILHRTRGESDDAIRVYETALRHGELNQLAWRNLGMSYKDKGDLAKAEEYVRRSLDVDPDYLLGWVDLARILYRRGDQEKSAETWNKVIAMAPYGWEAKEASHYLFYLEKGEEVPAKTEGGEGWTFPDVEEARKKRQGK
ncbi:MAG: tetratricopeptide repeat protein [Candidatus Eisenbacteria bacterium]